MVDAVYELDAYRALFSGITDEVAIGEASTSYLHCPGVQNRLILIKSGFIFYEELKADTVGLC